MMRARWSAAGAVAGGLVAACALASCAEGPSVEELAAQTVVVTQTAPGADLSAYRTFAMGDTIPVVREGAGDAGLALSTPADPAIAAPTLEAIAAELSARGYRRVDRTEKPDLGVAATGVVRVSAAVPYGSWWGYGAATGGYWGYGGSAFGSGIGGTGVAVLWKSGALVIELYDLRAARDAAASPEPSGAAPPIEAVWAAYIYGVIGGLDATIQAPPIEGIRQAFAQSPELRTP